MRIITQNEFDEAVKEGLVLVDFYADWCGPCKMMGPVLEQLQQKLEGQLTIYKVNVDNDMELARRFNIISIPNLFLLKDGEVVDQVMGYHPAAELEQFVRRAM